MLRSARFASRTPTRTRISVQTLVNELREELNEQRASNLKRDAHYSQLEVTLSQKTGELKEYRDELERVGSAHSTHESLALPLLRSSSPLLFSPLLLSLQ